MLISALLLVSCACNTRGIDYDTSEKEPQFPATRIIQASIVHNDDPYAALRFRVRSIIDSLFQRRPLNGAILVAQGNDIILEEYRGRIGYINGRSLINSTSAFHLASISKTFTAMATLKLCEEGKLSLQDEVAKHLKGFPVKGITVRTLLNHRSGLPNYVHYMERLGWDKKRRITNKDVLDFLIVNYNKVGIAKPDSRFDYSNTNYALLALIIEKVTGKFMGEYMKESIFVPLGMKDTYVFTLADSARSMPSYYLSGRQFAFNYLDLVYGDKNIYSTPRDLLKFDRGLKACAIVKEKYLDSAYLPYSFERPGENNYGLGWRMNIIENGKKIIYHNGWWHGNRTSFIRLLDEDVTIITLCNNDDMKVYSAKKLADLFGDYRQQKEAAPVIAKKTTSRKKATAARKKKSSSTARSKKKPPVKSNSSRTAKK